MIYCYINLQYIYVYIIIKIIRCRFRLFDYVFDDLQFSLDGLLLVH